MLLSIFAAIILQVTGTFWSYWVDGKAELNRYQTIQNRYGSDREAKEILIYVTEPFNLEKQVKSDTYDLRDKNKAQVLKLNRIKDFQTGLYDYNLMTSVFTAIDPFQIDNVSFSKGEVVKITFSAHDWCGHVFHQLNRIPTGMESSSYSYFETEGDQNLLLPTEENTLFIDNLFIDVRELIREMPEGEVTLYQSLENTRLFHAPLKIQNTKIEKSNDNFDYNGIDHPVTIVNIESGNENWQFIVEKEYPKKILYYEYSKNDKIINKGKLLKSVRLPYWQLHNIGDEKYLKELGY
jgi:hypothetical protein